MLGILAEKQHQYEKAVEWYNKSGDVPAQFNLATLYYKAKVKADSAKARAEQLFDELKMYQTEQRNAVLIYLSFKPRFVAVIGDEGIHQKVGDDFWQAVYNAMKVQCQSGQFTQAICNGIQEVEKQLTKYYPIQPDDVDELSNEVIIK
ncbi:MAG: TPM domain-containing protein [Pasteurella sp.]|nr:TPM domain-containing protein [Pasteurella sp.]